MACRYPFSVKPDQPLVRVQYLRLLLVDNKKAAKIPYRPWFLPLSSNLHLGPWRANNISDRRDQTNEGDHGRSNAYVRFWETERCRDVTMFMRKQLSTVCSIFNTLKSIP